MQKNVKVFTPEVLVDIFGHVNVKGDFMYKLRLDHINSRELGELAKINEDYDMNFHIRRSGKGLIVYSPGINIPDGNEKSPMSKHEELARAAAPMVEYLKKYYHPHATSLITGDSVEVLEGKIAVSDVFEELGKLLNPS